MNPVDVAAVLIAVAAIAGYVNHRLLRLPATSGTLVVALASSFALLAADGAFPRLELRRSIAAFLGEVDFNQTVMHGTLCFLRGIVPVLTWRGLWTRIENTTTA